MRLAHHAAEIAPGNHRVLGPRKGADVLDVASERSLTEQVELDVRRVEERDGLAPVREPFRDRLERLGPAEITDDWNYPPLSLQRLEELEIVLSDQEARLATGEVLLEIELSNRRIVG